MARHKTILPPESDEPSLDISSLIDVCFLLLIYFIVTTQIVKKEQELSSTLPTPNHSTAPLELAGLVLIIEENGTVAIKNESGLIEEVERDTNLRDLPRLSERLELYRTASLISGHQPIVKLKVHDNAIQQRVTDVLNALTGAEITKVTFIARPEDS